MRRALDVLFGFDAIEREINEACEKAESNRKAFRRWFSKVCQEEDKRRVKGMPPNDNLDWCGEYQAGNPEDESLSFVENRLKRKCKALVMCDRMIAIYAQDDFYEKPYPGYAKEAKP